MRERLLCLWGACFGIAHAQPPAIGQNGVFNSASRIPSGLTGASLARGSRFTMEGVRLAGNDARVVLRHGESSIVLPVLSAEPRQLEAWMPAAAPLGAASLRVITAAGESKPFSIAVVDRQPGLYSTNGKGWGQAKTDVLGAGGHRAPNTPEAPAPRGAEVEIAGAGLGAGSIEVFVGGRAAPVISVRRAPERGMDSIRFRIPDDAPKGCFVPVYTLAAGVRSNVVTLAIGDGRCEMPANWPWPMASGRRVGLLAASRSAGLRSTADEAFAAFYEVGAMAQPRRLAVLPPLGTCTAYTALYHVDAEEFESIAAALANPGNFRPLDAGMQVAIAGSKGSRVMPPVGAHPGNYWVRLGSEDPSGRHGPLLFLNDSRYDLSVAGGSEVPRFTAALPGLPAFEWTNRDALASVTRSRGIVFTWRGAPRDALMLALAASFDAQSTAGEICYCAARPEAGRIVMTPQMLAHFPPTGPLAGPLRSGVMLAAVRLQTGNPPPGLDQMRLMTALAQGQKSDFR